MVYTFVVECDRQYVRSQYASHMMPVGCDYDGPRRAIRFYYAKSKKCVSISRHSRTLQCSRVTLVMCEWHNNCCFSAVLVLVLGIDN